MQTEHTAAFLDLTPFIDGSNAVLNDPVSKLPMIQVALPLNRGEVWHARILPVIANKPDEAIAWSLVREGQLVRIPLLPYRVNCDLAELTLGIIDVTQCLVEAWPYARRTHIVVGKQIQDLRPEGFDNFRVWIGFAARTE